MKTMQRNKNIWNETYQCISNHGISSWSIIYSFIIIIYALCYIWLWIFYHDTDSDEIYRENEYKKFTILSILLCSEIELDTMNLFTLETCHIFTVLVYKQFSILWENNITNVSKAVYYWIDF